MTMAVARDSFRSIAILDIRRWAATVARASQRCVELALDHRLDELAYPLTQSDFDRVKPIVEKIDRRPHFRLQGRRHRASIDHGVVSTGALMPGLFGFHHPETTPWSIPTTSRTAPPFRRSARKPVVPVSRAALPQANSI